ncbi:MAG: hypothetical protein ABI267_08225 [Ginsengibacter sp.]
MLYLFQRTIIRTGFRMMDSDKVLNFINGSGLIPGLYSKETN